MTDLTAIKKNIQVEETQYKSSVSESTMQKIGSSLNWVNQNSVHVLGEIKQSMLTVAQFQAEIGTTWVLCNGQTASGSDYEALTGNSNVPDFVTSQRFPRQTNSDVNLGTTQTSDNLSHAHSVSGFNGGAISGSTNYTSINTVSPTGSSTTNASGGSESRPHNIWVNFFIKINR